VLRDCAQALAEVAALRGVLAGRLRIGTIPFTSAHVGLLELLRDYQQSYPAIEVVVSDEGSLSTVTAILAGSTDAAFIGLFRDQLPAGLTHQLLAQVDAACTRVGTRRQVACELRNPADLAALARQGLGVAIVPLRIAQAAADGDQASVLRLADPQAVQPVAVIYSDPPPASPPAQAFLRLVHSRWPPGPALAPPPP
jgi:DNA-binding transcriptional LysR family regulator